jgi:lambda repressor-like predicted transcriptional regulator
MAWSTLQIKRALKARGLTYKDVAEMGDVNESVVAKNVRKVEGCKSFPARLAIADALGVDVHEMFGSKKVTDQTFRNTSRSHAA